MELFCVDPGKLTGIVWLHVPVSDPVELVYWEEVPGTMAGIYNALASWKSRRTPAGDAKAICEDWDYRHNTPTDARLACYPAGMVQMLAFEEGIECVMQRPAYRATIPDDPQKLPEQWRIIGGKYKAKDARQALRHGLAHVIHNMHHRPSMELLNPRTV